MAIWVALSGAAAVIYERVETERAAFIVIGTALYGLVGALSHLALHFAAYRKARY